MILGGLSLIGGWIGISKLLSLGAIPNYFHEYLEPTVTKYGEVHVGDYSHFTEYSLMLLSVAIAIAGWYLAKSKFAELKKRLPEPDTYTGMAKLLWNKYYVDEIYMKLIVNPLKSLSTNIFLNISDKKIIDGAANGSAKGWRWVSSILSLFQNGDLQAYGFYMLFGVVLVYLLVMSFL